jgi:hypothetical protein
VVGDDSPLCSFPLVGSSKYKPKQSKRNKIERKKRERERGGKKKSIRVGERRGGDMIGFTPKTTAPWVAEPMSL